MMAYDIKMADSSRLGILDLSMDVLTMILDLIPAKVDLVNICLVSHVFRQLVLYRLHRDFSINSRSPQDVNRFERSFPAGAAYSLRHTQSLTVWDTPGRLPPDHPLNNTWKPVRHRYGDSFIPDHLQRTAVATILKEFRVAELKRFRFLSHRSGLEAESWRFLSEHVNSLQHLHIDLVEWPLRFQPALQTLDIRIQPDFTPEALAVFLKENLAKLDCSLQHLHIGFADSIARGALRDVDEYAGRRVLSEAILRGDFTLAHFRSLTTLSFHNLDVHDLVRFGALPGLVKLKSLTIINCPGASHVMSELGLVSINSNSQLEHLNIELDWEEKFNVRLKETFNSTGEVHYGEPFDQCLEEVLENCERLTSLHVSWWDPRVSLPLGPLDENGQREEWESRQQPRCVLEKLPKMGHRLRSLSLHDHNLDDDECTFGDANVRRSMYENCPNLEELGIQEMETLTDPDGVGWPEFLTANQGLGKLQKLRIIHFRQKHDRKGGGGSYNGAIGHGTLPPYIVEQFIRWFVENFAKELMARSHCPKLEYIVWGSDDHFDADEDNIVRYTSQKCYWLPFKVLGIDYPAALPITREQLEANHPEFDIIRNDPMPSSKSIRLPGRLYNDLKLSDMSYVTKAHLQPKKEEVVCASKKAAEHFVSVNGIEAASEYYARLVR